MVLTVNVCKMLEMAIFFFSSARFHFAVIDERKRETQMHWFDSQQQQHKYNNVLLSTGCPKSYAPRPEGLAWPKERHPVIKATYNAKSAMEISDFLRSKVEQWQQRAELQSTYFASLTLGCFLLL